VTAGQIGIREAQAGVIRHAPALQIIAPAKWWMVRPKLRASGARGD
jgi:hypothetical protein